MFKLVIEDDEGNKTVVPIIRDEITIGRKDGNTIRLTERNVSREHAKLVRRDGDIFLKELSARYGTRKNGDKIGGETEFGVGDVFSIGDYRLTLQSDVAPEKEPAKPNGASPPPLKADAKSPGPPKSRTRPKKEGTEIIATDPAKLVIVSSNFAGQEFPLARMEMVIGRGEECDIIIDHRSVSQKHAKVVREQSGEYKIVDLKSKNGVKVGGEDYRAVHLKRGDIVELGHVKFRFVESGENYVFTPQLDADLPQVKSSKLPLIGALIVVGAIVAGALLFMNAPKTTAIAGTTTAADPNNLTVAAVPVDEPNDLDQKIDKAEADYLAGKVQKASGMLELLRDDDVTPQQVERIDDLLSKTKREIGFARYFENGRDHFEAERWVAALTAFREIPDDDELNIYRLLKEEQYIDKAVAAATLQQLEVAKASKDEGERAEARDMLAELQAMFPSHVAPPEAIAELAAAGQPRPTPKPVRPRVRRPKPPEAKPDPPPSATIEVKAPPSDSRSGDELKAAAMQELLQGKHRDAISTAKAGTKNGCQVACYRIIAMAHHKLGESKSACSWFAKAASELPPDLDCP